MDHFKYLWIQSRANLAWRGILELLYYTVFLGAVFNFFSILGFPCDTCGKQYKRKSSVREHKRFECMKEPQFACPACEYKAKLKGTLKKHMINRHCLNIDLYYKKN
ncbi:unnamed protein product [Psylliodes chrysocephalus]|uniref:C2H2-type domain-containing protein n=1 Tax=Psylliodes chrysocephalus TaxID=3402493 RepID=A0A9P0CPE8_9CUCU|nr:unnamed protein product [Psylliodes chrysocephala]